MDAWILELVGCAFDGCGGRLGVEPGGTVEDGALIDGVLSCTQCEAPYPVLGGVPILTPLPTQWLATYRESVLAALAECGLASPTAVAIVDTFVQPAGPCEPMRFGDDWTEAGADDLSPPSGTDQSSEFDTFLRGARDWGPQSVLAALMGTGPLGTLVEIGCGDGALANSLRHGAARMLVGDLSLRAVLRTLAAAAEEGGPPIAGAVLDAENLGLQAGVANTLVAASVTDLLDEPQDFVAHVGRALARGGRAALSSPEPADLEQLLETAGLSIARQVDGVPWIRAHTERYFQVYFVKALLAVKG